MRPSASVSRDATSSSPRIELDAHAGGGLAAARCRGRGSRSRQRIFPPGPDGAARSRPRRRARAGRRGRPPRRRRRAGRRGAGAERTSPATGSRHPPISSASVRHTATSARLPGSSEPMSSRPSTAAPPRVPRRSASRAVIACRPAARAGDEQRLLDLEEQVAALVRRRAVDAEPDAHARVEQRRAPARCRRRAACSTSGSARRRRRRSAKVATSSSFRWTQCAHQTSDSIQPSCSRYSTGRQP